jgi:inosine triphosphate pyrophosphatase
MPGPYIRSFLEALGEAGLYTLISHYEDRSVYATCTIGFLENEHSEPHIFQSSLKGTIVAPRGNITHHGKTSWNRIVQPDGFDKTFAEITLEEISRISPRGQAVRQLKEFLKAK